jgi:hypothetical protein
VVRWMDDGIVRRVREQVTILPGAVALGDLHAAGVPCGLVSASCARWSTPYSPGRRRPLRRDDLS